MKLEAYLKERGMPKKEFSRRSKVPYPTILRATKGMKISLAYAVKIARACEGKVSIEDLSPTEVC
jgi:predicted transcriptional regulator